MKKKLKEIEKITNPKAFFSNRNPEKKEKTMRDNI